MPTVKLIDPGAVDPQAFYAVSFDGLVNSTTFNNGLVSFGGWQYTAWYTADRTAMIARRPFNGAWQKVQLSHVLTGTDSHDVISIGICPIDGTIHLAMDTHKHLVYYIVSEAGVATDPENSTWDTGTFSSVMRTFNGLDPGTMTYPWFVISPDGGKLQCNIRTAGNHYSGRNELLEYDGVSWVSLGHWTTNEGSYTHRGATSTSRYGYLHGMVYGPDNKLHAAGTWREQNEDICCSPGGITNHDTWYVQSDDFGRTWKNGAGTQVGTTGSDLVGFSDPGLVANSVIPPDYGLLNSESMVVDSTGQVHVIVSYVPGRFGNCNSYDDRAINGRIVHARSGNNWLRREVANGSWRNGPGYIADYPLSSLGRTQIALDAADNAYLILPRLRILAATAASEWSDWTPVFDGADSSALQVYGECMVDRARLLADGVLSVAYQQTSTGTTPSAFCVRDFLVTA